MFCKKCGNKIEEGAAFCNNCGTPIEGVAENSNNDAANDVADTNIKETTENAAEKKTTNETPLGAEVKTDTNNATSPKTKASSNTKVLIPVIGAVAAAFIIILLIVTAKTTVKLDKYISVEFDGYDTVGTARVVFDRESFLDDYGKKIKYTNAFKKSEEYRFAEAFGLSISKSDSAELLLSECISNNLDKNNSLSNGDTVVVEWNCDDEEALAYFGCKLKYSDLEYTVKGLEEARIIDPFINVNVSYSGIAPNGKVDIQYTGDLQGIYFYVANNNCYSNGDKVTVKATYGGKDANEQSLINQGVLLSETSKEFVVEGLDAYATKLDDINDTAMNSMKKQSEDIFAAWVAKTWVQEWSVNDIEYIGSYFLTPKTDSVFGDKNRIILVYKVIADFKYENKKKEYTAKVSFLYPVQFSNIMVLNDGTVSVDTSRGAATYDQLRKEYDLGGMWRYAYIFYGYDNIETLFNKYVTQNVNNYNYESDINESKFEKIDEFEKK